MYSATNEETTCPGNCWWKAAFFKAMYLLKDICIHLNNRPNSARHAELEQVLDDLKSLRLHPSDNIAQTTTRTPTMLDDLLPVATEEDALRLDGFLAQDNAAVRQRMLQLLGSDLNSVFCVEFLANCKWSTRGAGKKWPFNVYTNIVNILIRHFGHEAAAKEQMQKRFKNEDDKLKRNTFAQRYNLFQGRKYQIETDCEQIVKQCTAIVPSTNICLPSNNSSSTATTASVPKIVFRSPADLNMKIASARKVWKMPSISKQRDVVADDSIVTSSGSGGNEAAVHTTTSYCTVMHPGHATNYQHNVIGNTDQLSTSPGQSPYSTFPQDQGALDRRHFVNANKATDPVSEGGIVVPGAVTAETDDTTKSYVANHQQSLETQAASQNIQQTRLTIQQAQQPQQQSHQQLHNQQLHHQQQAQHQLQQPQQQLHQQPQLQLQQAHQHQQNTQQPQQQHHSHLHHHQQQHQQQHQHHQQLHLQQQQLQQDQQLLQQEQQKQNQQRQPQQHQHLSQHQDSVSTQQHQTVAAGMASLNKHSVDVLAAAAAASSANVCKVKPTQQGMHQTGNLDLSPPPSMQSGTIPSAPQPYYPAQYGVSAVPSPPAVLYNSAAAMTSQGGLYNAFHLAANGQSQFTQFPGHYGTSGASGPYNAYMATPTNIPTANPTPEIYQIITSPFCLESVQSPYGNQAAQLNSPSTMLISSNNNSWMSFLVNQPLSK